ncbi:MAG TPA: tetratricopeptide repeat protein [Opitutaceae bacterium]|nr:tetratricopeptide repeat protein [Opitutaceae bacterium]
MTASDLQRAASDRSHRPERGVLVAALLLAGAALLAYANSLHVPLQFDDKGSLLENPSILTLWPPSVPLSPPGWGLTVQGRPLLNLSLAVNYALGGFDVRGYHAVNLAIHFLAGLALFGLVRRTLRGPRLRNRYGAASLSLATAVAAIWLLHPLQVESVTYLVQRAESLAGLFVLLTLYAFARSTETAPVHRGWAAVAVAAALAGVATKESAVVAPVLAFLYDRTFVAGTFRDAWRRRRLLYALLGTSWLLLACLVVRAGSRGGTFELGNPVAWWQYGLTQAIAVTQYLRAAAWPATLAFDYGTFWVGLGQAWPHVLVVATMVIAVGYALIRLPMIGFIGAWFFVTLAPSSVLPGTIQMIVEHRMYLPLAAVAVAAAGLLAGLSSRRRMIALGAVVAGLGLLTAARNRAYRSEVSLWSDTVTKRPQNARAYANLGGALYADGRYAEARGWLERACRMDPSNPEAHFNLGLTYRKERRTVEAVPEFAAAVRLKPQMATADFELALALIELGRGAEARPALERAIAMRPRYAEAHGNLGVLLAETGHRDAAIVQYLTALEIRPDYAEAAANLGALLLRAGRPDLAIERLTQALRSDDRLAGAHFSLGLAFATVGRRDEAIREYLRAVELDPTQGEAHLNLGIAFAETGRSAEAQRELERAVALLPDSPEAHQNLGNVLAGAGRPEAAESHYRTALRLRPTYAEAHYNYGNTLIALRRLDEARGQFEQALACDPGLVPAREMLRRLDAVSGQLP